MCVCERERCWGQTLKALDHNQVVCHGDFPSLKTKVIFVCLCPLNVFSFVLVFSFK